MIRKNKNNTMKLKDQEYLYAVLEGRHGADDDDRDNGGFFISMPQEYSRNSNLLKLFCSEFDNRRKRNELSW